MKLSDLLACAGMKLSQRLAFVGIKLSHLLAFAGIAWCTPAGAYDHTISWAKRDGDHWAMHFVGPNLRSDPGSDSCRYLARGTVMVGFDYDRGGPAITLPTSANGSSTLYDDRPLASQLEYGQFVFQDPWESDAGAIGATYTLSIDVCTAAGQASSFYAYGSTFSWEGDKPGSTPHPLECSITARPISIGPVAPDDLDGLKWHGTATVRCSEASAGTLRALNTVGGGIVDFKGSGGLTGALEVDEQPGPKGTDVVGMPSGTTVPWSVRLSAPPGGGEGGTFHGSAVLQYDLQ